MAPISQVNRLLPGGLAHEISKNPKNDRDVHNLIERIPQHLKFTEKEGYAELELGVPK